MRTWRAVVRDKRGPSAARANGKEERAACKREERAAFARVFEKRAEALWVRECEKFACRPPRPYKR